MSARNTRRKPRLDPLVPTRAIDRWLGTVHVTTPEAEIAETIESAPGLKTDPRWTPALVRQAVRYALWRHRQNFLDYAYVMGGR